jgi:hypothetical protein
MIRGSPSLVAAHVSVRRLNVPGWPYTSRVGLAGNPATTAADVVHAVQGRRSRTAPGPFAIHGASCHTHSRPALRYFYAHAAPYHAAVPRRRRPTSCGTCSQATVGGANVDRDVSTMPIPRSHTRPEPRAGRPRNPTDRPWGAAHVPRIHVSARDRLSVIGCSPARPKTPGLRRARSHKCPQRLANRAPTLPG